MRNILLLSLVLAVPAFGRDPTQQDYDIWAGFLRPHAQSGEVYVWHQIEPTSIFARGEEKSALYFHPEFTSSATAWSTEPVEIDVERLNAALKENDKFGFVRPVKLMDADMLEKIVGKKPRPSWILSPRLIPGVEAICRLSWPAIHEDRPQAYIICGDFSMWKGSITSTIMRKVRP